MYIYMIAADVYLRRLDGEQAKAQFECWQNVLQRSLDCLPMDENGLVWNHADPPHSPYGFTDCIVKTGKLAMETLLLWQALKIMKDWGAVCGQDTAELKKRLRSIESVFASTFTEGSGMLLALRFRDVRIGSQVRSAVVAFAPEGLGSGDRYQALTGGVL